MTMVSIMISIMVVNDDAKVITILIIDVDIKQC